MEYIITDEELERICDLVHDTYRDLLGQIRLRPLPLSTDLSQFQTPHVQTVPNYRDQWSLKTSKTELGKVTNSTDYKNQNSQTIINSI